MPKTVKFKWGKKALSAKYPVGTLFYYKSTFGQDPVENFGVVTGYEESARRGHWLLQFTRPDGTVLLTSTPPTLTFKIVSDKCCGDLMGHTYFGVPTQEQYERFTERFKNLSDARAEYRARCKY